MPIVESAIPIVISDNRFQICVEQFRITFDALMYGITTNN